MAVVLETLSVKKLLALGAAIIAILITFFYVGSQAPPPTNAMQHISTVCNGKNVESALEPWSCKKIDLHTAQEDPQIHPQDIVFVFQFPHQGLEMSRWFQFIAMSVQMKLDYNKDNPYKSTEDGYPVWTFDAKLYYKDKNSTGKESWSLLAESLEKRDLVCHVKGDDEGGYYTCDDLPFFEIGSVHHEFYLVNVRLPGHRAQNRGIGQVSGLEFVEIHQNGGFTETWLILKSVVAPISVIILVWFSLRVKKLRREVLLLEKTMFVLGFITVFLNLPFEWMTLYADMPFMLLFSDIRQGLFYAMMMCFWVIFTGEHLLDQSERNRIKAYLPQICFISIGGFSLLVFDMCERGYQLHNPFYSIWATKLGSDLAYGFIISAGVCASIYFLFLLVMVVKVFLNIRGKRATFKNMSRARRLNYEGLIFRFEFLMVMTLLCAALTVIFFIITNVNEVHWRFGDEESSVEISSALLTGIYGMWNVYVLTVMFLYAPSAGDPLSAQYDANRETVELTGTTDPTSGAKESIVYAMAGKASQE